MITLFVRSVIIVLAFMTSMALGVEKSVHYAGNGLRWTTLSTGDSYPGPYRDGKDLLNGINRWRHYAGLQPIDYDTMVATLAERARSGKFGGELNSKIGNFFEALKGKKPFKDDVHLYAPEIVVSRIPFADGREISVPPFFILEVHILNYPYGSKDSGGYPMKIDWSTIEVGCALMKDYDQRVEKEKKQREHHS